MNRDASLPMTDSNKMLIINTGIHLKMVAFRQLVQRFLWRTRPLVTLRGDKDSCISSPSAKSITNMKCELRRARKTPIKLILHYEKRSHRRFAISVWEMIFVDGSLEPLSLVIP